MPGFVSRPAQRRFSRSSAGGYGERQTRRRHLSDLEQSSAENRRSAKPRGRQQPDPIAANRIPRDHRADGIYEWFAPGGTDVSGTAVQRAGFDQIRLLLRAGDQTPQAAGKIPVPYV